MKRLIAEYGISTEPMDPSWAARASRAEVATPLADILVGRSTYHRGHVKRAPVRR
jgi:hypothetical protein